MCGMLVKLVDFSCMVFEVLVMWKLILVFILCFVIGRVSCGGVGVV